MAEEVKMGSLKRRKKKKKKKKISNIGKWGDISFVVSRNKIRTFSDMKWTSTYNYDVKERKKKVSKVAFKGIAPDEFSFGMRFSVFEGMNPLKEMEKLNKAARKGTAQRLIIGGKKYGKYKLVITKISRELSFFDNKGNLWIADVQVSMKEKPQKQKKKKKVKVEIIENSLGRAKGTLGVENSYGRM